MSRQFGHFAVQFPNIATVADNVAQTTEQARIAIPYDANVVGIIAHAGTCDDALSAVDIYDEGLDTPATVLGADVTVAVADTVYNGLVSSTYASTEYKKGRMFTVRVSTTQTSGGIDNLQVTLILKKLDY